jgi:hypothetical protein
MRHTTGDVVEPPPNSSGGPSRTDEPTQGWGRAISLFPQCPKHNLGSQPAVPARFRFVSPKAKPSPVTFVPIGKNLPFFGKTFRFTERSEAARPRLSGPLRGILSCAFA